VVETCLLKWIMSREKVRNESLLYIPFCTEDAAKSLATTAGCATSRGSKIGNKISIFEAIYNYLTLSGFLFLFPLPSLY
jgi:hypothetical protein